MPDNEIEVMHYEFARWYREVDLQENRERLQRRWIGLCALIKQLNRKHVESMIRFLLRTEHASWTENIDFIRQPFRHADDFFDMSGNDRELEILSGATLAVLLEKGTNLAASAALGVTTGAFDGARLFRLPMDLGGLAEQAIANIAETRRRRPNLSRFTSDDTVKAYLNEALAANQDEPLKPSFTPIRLVLDSIAETNAFIAVQDEELQILWWLFGERSHDLDRPFTGVTAEARPLVFAKELADATQLLPGPASARAILSRTGLRENKKLTVPAAVNKCDLGWLASLVNNDNPSPVLMPIHFAIHRKLETRDEASWVEGWGAASGIKPDHELPALTLSNLFYRERLLSKFPKE